MAMYLVTARYTTKGAKGLASEGGTSRREAVRSLAASVGGRLESFYFSFGDADVYVILDLPSQEAAAALALAVAAGGGAKVSTSVLLTPEQVDAARSLTPQYRPPGG